MNNREDKTIIDMYKAGSTNFQMQQKLKISRSTLKRRLKKLRALGSIDVDRYVTPSKVIVSQKEKDTAIAYLDEKELVKLLALYGSRKEVAKHLQVSTKLINELCKDYQINDTEHIAEQMIEALKTILSDVKPYKNLSISSGEQGDTLVCHLTDLHAGKVVEDQDGKIIYNQTIFKQRIDKLNSQILKLLDENITKGVPITDAIIISTGDLANGENIYATQTWEQELEPPRQVLLVVESITKLIVALVERGLTIKFYGVKGNHGRTDKEANPNSNWDVMIYLILDYWARNIYQNKNVQIFYSETDFMTFKIRGHGYLIRHIAPEQPDTPSGRVKFNEWARQHDVEAIVYGHYHHWMLTEVDGIRVIRGGSIVGGDSLSESMAKESEPSQLIWGVNDHRITTFMYAVDLASK